MTDLLQTNKTAEKSDEAQSLSGFAEAADTVRRIFGMLLLGPRAWRRWWHAFVHEIEHEKILEQVEQDASFSFNFNFMVIIAGGIATIGLLLNSPAVIIGAMLISPLMGPIVGGGMALATLDVNLGWKSARTLAVGTVGAIAFTALIVLLSPVKELTPELLARTRPNLFDLIVAILSGTAGGYAMIRGKGGAIVGVAIATALMPPLATIGFGLVTEQWEVASGAFLLFITNMAAIGFSIAAVAEWYGFGRGSLRKRLARQILIPLLVLVPLCIPLYFSLKTIAFESFAQIRVRNILEASAAALPSGELGAVDVLFAHDKPPSVRAVFFSATRVAGLSVKLQAEIEKALGLSVDLHLVQLRTTDEAASGLLARSVLDQPNRHIVDQLRAAFPLPLSAFEADPDTQKAIFVPVPQPGIDLAAWHQMEDGLSRQYSGWDISLLPPAQILPQILFESGSTQPDAKALEQIATIAWAVKRWKIGRVDVVGLASSDGGGSEILARKRAAQVAEVLREHGLTVATVGRYPLPNQLSGERELGLAAFRAVSVILPGGAGALQQAGAN